MHVGVTFRADGLYDFTHEFNQSQRKVSLSSVGATRGKHCDKVLDKAGKWGSGDMWGASRWAWLHASQYCNFMLMSVIDRTVARVDTNLSVNTLRVSLCNATQLNSYKASVN
jgi:hypothetical protein